MLMILNFLSPTHLTLTAELWTPECSASSILLGVCQYFDS